MLKVALLALLGVAFVAADKCSEVERLVIKEQWVKAYGFGNEREAFSEKLWQHLFLEEPEAVALFDRVKGNNVYSPQFRAHALRVNAGLDMCVSLLDDQLALDAQLAHLKAQHIERKIPDKYFAAFKRSLLDVVPATIGDCFVQDAWDHCLDDLNAAIMGGS